ncbi:putative tail fiber protein [Escherichia coli O157:H7 str. G5101]|nr:putative tail fiber protein [Escherichia coli O157:H7 str. G5101]
MAVKISGVLKDGTGKPVENCTIQLKARRTSSTVVVNTVASENPDEAGRYSMDVEYGQYSVILLVEGFPPSHAGTITVYEDSQPGTLNDFLGAMSEDDVRPEALRRFELMVEEAARHAEEAKKNAGEAETSARNAGISASQAEESAANADTSAGEHRSQPGRRQKVQPLQSSQRRRPRPRPLRPLKKPVSHHKVQQMLSCQERRQKVQPVMHPGMQRPQQKKPGSQQKAHSQRNKAG